MLCNTPAYRADSQVTKKMECCEYGTWTQPYKLILSNCELECFSLQKEWTHLLKEVL